VEQERETVRAQARYVRTSARKARLVLEHIRGRSAAEATTILAFQTRAAARDAGKVLASAIANAENNNGHDVDDLFVLTAVADEGPTLKRWRPRARGRVNRIRKRTCHITITLAVAEPGEVRRARVPAAPPEPVAEPEPAAEAEVEAPEAAEPEAAETEAPEAAETEAAESEAAAEPEAKPKPRRAPRARKPKAKPAEAQGGEEAAEEPKPKPKPKRAPRTRKPKAEAEPTPDTETTEEEK
jgi:large subunit ribosomal protein L22